MNDRSPRVAFGLALASATWKAKARRLTLRDQIDLAVAALRHAAHDPAVCAPVAQVLAGAGHASLDTAPALATLLDSYLRQLPTPEALDVTAATSDDLGQAPLFDWQSRADLR